MTFLLNSIYQDPVFLIIFEVTAIFGIAILIASAFPKTAAIRNCILFSGFVCSFICPGVLIWSTWTGVGLEVPVLVADAQIQAPPKEVDTATALPEPVDFSADFVLIPVETVNEEVWPLLEQSDSPIDIAQPDAMTPAVPDPKRSVSWTKVGLGIWFGGAAFYLFGILISLYRIFRLKKSVEPINPNLFPTAIAQAAQNIGVKKYPRVGLTDQVDAPAAMGLTRNAWVLFPKKYLHSMTPEQLTQVLTHEGAHVVRRDPLVQLLQRFSLSLWWWHPLAHVLNSQLGRAREEICDNFVLNQTDADVYGSTLLKLGKLISTDRQLITTVSLFGLRWKLEHRIQGLLNPRRKTMIHVNKAAFTVFLTGCVGLTLLAGTTRLQAQERGERERTERKERAEHERERAEHDLERAEHERERVEHERELAEHEQERVERAMQERDVENQQHANERVLRERESNQKVGQKLEHLMAARKHLAEAGLTELADVVAQHADQLARRGDQWTETRSRLQHRRTESSLEEADRERAIHETRVREQRMSDEMAEERAQRRQLELLNAQQRERELKDYKDLEQGPPEMRRREGRSQEFQQEMIGAIRELNATVRQMREELDELKKRDK